MAEASHTTVIGPDTKIKGEMTFESTARLLGTFEGKIQAKGELQVADSAQCRASVDAGKVLVDGLVEGNINARERVELTARAKMKGDLVSTKLVVADGATFVGHVTVGPEAAKMAGSSGGGSAASSIEGKPADTRVTPPNR
ncbi:MAG: polymer-forming cytoskeletal protein [Phycisphaerales bacterium]|nr:MAG: polymer-forming cytoskeletal protein [Phycisphaerales bacterium]